MRVFVFCTLLILAGLTIVQISHSQNSLQGAIDSATGEYGEVFGLARVCDDKDICPDPPFSGLSQLEAFKNMQDRCVNDPCSTDELNAIWHDMLEEISVDSEAVTLAASTRVADIMESTQRIDCTGIAKQGGLVICRTAPNAIVEVGRSETDTYRQKADANGILIVGFDRDEPNAFVRVGDARIDFNIEQRDYDISRIDGLPSNMVSEYTEDELKRIRAASARKKVGFASKVEDIGFRNGFIYPVTDHIKTTNFGAQRILNGEPKRPHFGVDLAAPKGTPILAPADGIVSLADDDMYFEGSLIMIDHGQGLISYYLHNEEVMVEAGQRVKQGDQIGTVGSRGRSTGPHLCWRLKWRGRNLDPELIVTDWPKSEIVDG